MSTPFPFPQVARVPAPGDNVAIAIRRLDAGTLVSHDGRELRLPHTVLEGHRFALKPIAVGEPLLSWGLPFGEAVRPIHPGDYVCNESIIAALRQRHVNFPLPEYGNFQNKFAPVRLDEQTFQPGKEVEKYPDPATFEGFARDPQRGAGTRNYIAILGTTSLTASYSRALADRFKAVAKEFPNIDGVVAIAHTEGGGSTRPNNFDFTVRTLAGMMVNPSIGAVLAVDFGAEVITNETLREFMRVNSYPTENLLHRFLSLEGSFEESLAEGEKIVRAWLDPVNAFHRTPQPLANLRIGLQCGGSDAFSGISGNPLVGWLSHELVRHGGSANLAETDELIGAEPYILANVRDYATARAFLAQLKRFQDRAGWHGSSAEGNPSGGNMFRGLYNIAIKSIGAARKKDPATRLDYVIDYGQRMTGPGFYFMDSPGNDLESIAGQVAAGCNLIVFTTGNGSITNFPFVPTIKVMTNTGRFNLLRREMDFNAGRYLDGEPMEELGREIFDYARSVASGRRSAGEQAGHSQVQLWREWRQTDSSRLEELLHAPKPDGQPLPLKPSFRPDLYAGMFQFDVWRGEYGPATERVGLIVPTSLCSSQIARLIADKLNHAIPGTSAGASHRYVALPHTEGCGVSAGESEKMYLRTMCGYLVHPMVTSGLLLEHGCERTHNDALEDSLEEAGVDPKRFGWASVQLDGGIENVTRKVIQWFGEHGNPNRTPKASPGGIRDLGLGLTCVGNPPKSVACAFAQVAGTVVDLGGTIIIPEHSPLLNQPEFQNQIFERPVTKPTLAYGQSAKWRGLHIMETPTDHHVETLTGLGATGVSIILSFVDGPPAQAHPLVPVLQITTAGNPRAQGDQRVDWDLIWGEGGVSDAESLKRLWDLIAATAARRYNPRLFLRGNVDFQMTRGLLGVSL